MPSIIQINTDPKKILSDRNKIKKAMKKDISPTYFIKGLTQKAVQNANLISADGTLNSAHILSYDNTQSLSQRTHIRDTFSDGTVKNEMWVVRSDYIPYYHNNNYPRSIYASAIIPTPTNDYFVTALTLGNATLYIKPVSMEYVKTYNVMSNKYDYNLSIFYAMVTNVNGNIDVINIDSKDIDDLLNGRTIWNLSSDLQHELTIQANKDALKNYIVNYNLTEWLKYEAYVWQNELDKHIKHLWTVLDDSDVNRTLRFIGNKEVDLENYKTMHDDLMSTGRWSKMELEKICRDNINIQMVHILDSIKNDIDKFPVINPPKPGYQATAVDGTRLSNEQTAAVCSTEPLLLITAGAGTGKTQVITARAKFLIDHGVKPDDILMLSFTRTAASTVESRLPGIKSLTINAFVDSIYSNNYPDQSIDDTMTFINTLKTVRKSVMNDLDKSNFYQEFATIMGYIYDHHRDAYAKLQTFVTEHFDEVMETCRLTGRTTFDIQMVTACVNIHNMTEPDDIQAKFMFVDEVQDNSIFDFIFAIKYCEKHHISLTIVGDASQTLFEFRGADTKAIGVIEKSDVFSKEVLNINYRSINEVLAIANTMLTWIDANKTANIQLTSDRFAKPTTQSFTDTVKLSYDCVGGGGDKAFRELIWDKDAGKSAWLTDEIKSYIDGCLAKGEKVAFLAYQRRPLEHLQKALLAAYPNKTITNLTPPQPYQCNIFSYYAANCDIKGAPYTNVLATLKASLERCSPTMRNAVKAKANGEYSPTMNVFETMWTRFVGKFAIEIDKWADDVKNGIITDEQFDENIRHALLDTETEYNAELNRSKLSNNASQERADAKAKSDILLCTIHSAKGDEFDNCVVFYHDDNNMSEEDKRMYYVAFTRAQKTLFISAYGSDKHPLIEAQYQETARNL